MELRFAPKNVLEIDNAENEIWFKNFAGRGDAYNREGDRNFTLRFNNPELVDELVKRGWNVNIKPPRDEEEDPRMQMKVKVKFSEYGPDIFLHVGDAAPVRLTEETVGLLDGIRFARVDMDVRAYDWSTPGGRSGRTAYLNTMHVTQELDRFAERYGARVKHDEEDDYLD